MPKLSVDLDTIRRLARFAARRGAQDRIPQVAGSLTFTTMLALVPLVTVAFALFTAFPMFSSFQSSLQGFLAEHLMPAQFNSQIFKYLNQFASKAKGLTTAGLIALVVTSVMMLMTIESAFNVIWRVTKPRPFAQRVLSYWALITLGPLLFGVSLSTTSYLVTHSLAFAGSSPGPALEWLLTAASLPLTAVAFTLLYVYLPNCTVAWRDALVGGLCAAVAFELAKRGFGFYVRRIPTYTAVYGAFATVPMFLLWMYLSWFITLAGAMIASALPAIRIGQFHRVHYPGSDLLDALELLARLAAAQQAGRPGYPATELAVKVRCDLDTAQRLLATMEEREWVARLQADGNTQPRYVLLANPEQLTLRGLFDVLVVTRSEIAYHAQRGKTHVDCALLLDALSGDRLDVPLAALIGRHAGAAKGGVGEGPGAGSGGGAGSVGGAIGAGGAAGADHPSALPHRAA